MKLNVNVAEVLTIVRTSRGHEVTNKLANIAVVLVVNSNFRKSVAGKVQLLQSGTTLDTKRIKSAATRQINVQDASILDTKHLK